MTGTRVEVLHPILPAAGAATTDLARWIGEAQIGDDFADEITATDAQGYHRARLLVRDGRAVRGYIEVGVEDATILGREVRREMSRLPQRPAPTTTEDFTPPVTVVVCTRDRTDQVRRTIESLLALDYPSFEVVVVDNAASTLDTWRYIDSLDDPRVRVIHASVPGLAAARNRGLESAAHDIVAFTDDDVVVDRQWLTCLIQPLADADVACVTGLVPAAELRTPAQVAFEQRVHWSSSLDRRVYRMTQPRDRRTLFPFRVGDYGTGANFAVRRPVAFELGGFDEALGAGSPTRGGEDIDWFVRTIVSGRALAFEPDAIAWHQHRDDDDALATQAHGYGIGLGAWLTKVALDRDLAPLALARAGAAIGHLFTSFYSRTAAAASGDRTGPTGLPGAARRELAGLIAGPRALLTARAQGRKPKPFQSFAPTPASRPAVAAAPEPATPSSSAAAGAEEGVSS
ncbi:glycosyltransferase [Gordonia sp. ABSL1-1]|uniref:glycosyltransferase n=1 Tax=Gordonia sp. ABSL1-1 TaxID=3053923 RepID=UPI002573D7DC|nr:glycosyltransferase [Gordonia sp. ABSL1-1]MDL9936076.1 glycosyltransferase [Gordonia sp. ABSL1-1]